MRQREHSLQIAVAHMLQLVLDPQRTWWTAIDHGAGRMSPAAAGIRKARGVKRGLPDFLILARSTSPYFRPVVLGIELKTDQGKLSPDQLLVADSWLAMGQAICVARSLEEVQAILEHWHIPMRRKLTFWSQRHDPHSYEVIDEHPARAATARHRRPRRARKPPHNVSVVQRR